MEFLITLATFLGIPALVNQMQELGGKYSTSDLINFADKILVKAEQQGASVLNKIILKMQSIPYINSSGILKNYMSKARQNLSNKYNKVESNVNKMKNDAIDISNKIKKEASKTFLERLTTKNKSRIDNLIEEGNKISKTDLTAVEKPVS